MKKLLALVLALAMTLSLCITSNAAFAGEEYDYDEAVEVMAAVGVFQGDENGKFNGKAELTREQAAKLIAYLDLGEKVAEALPATKVFNDVAADRWSAKYVAYCADAGYIAGTGNGNFEPDGKLTGYAFGKMLLCALGYDAAIEGFTGANWTIKVAKLMQSNKLAKGIDGAASANLTREEAAQYCFNALKATMVEYDNKGATIAVNGATIDFGASKANKVAIEDEEGNYAGDDEDAAGLDYQQLCEKLYEGRLTVEGGEPDTFGRIGNKWSYAKSSTAEAEEIGTYGETADKVVVLDEDVTTEETLLAALQDIVDNDDLDYDEDHGYAVNCDVDTEDYALPAGTVVELFFDDDDNDLIENIVAYNYVLVEVTDVDKYDDESDEVKKYGITEEYTLELVSDAAEVELSFDGDFVDAMNSKADDEEYNAIGTWEEDDQFFALVNSTDGTIVNTFAVKTVEGKKTASGAAYVKVDGTKYVATGDVVALFDSYDDTFTAYVDPQGSVIYAEVKEEAETTYKYAYVFDAASDFDDADLLTGVKSSAAVKVIYTNGEIETLKYAVTKATKATTGANDAEIAKGDYYYTFCGEKYAIDVEGADDTFDTNVVEGWYAYTLNDDGYVTLKSANIEGKSAVAASAFDEESVTVADLSGLEVEDWEVELADLYATTTTKLTVLDTEDGVLKTYTGYKAIREAETFEAPNALFLTNSDMNKAIEIFIVEDGYTDTVEVNAALFAATGDTVDGGFVGTFYVDGKKVEYTVSEDCETEFTVGCVYDIDVEDNEVTDATDVTELDPAAVLGVVDVVGDDYVVVGDETYTFDDDGCAVWQVSKDCKSLTKGTLKTGQNVLLVVVDAEDQTISQIFIYKTDAETEYEFN